MLRRPRIHFTNLSLYVVQRGHNRDVRFFGEGNCHALVLCLALFAGCHSIPAIAFDMAMQGYPVQHKGAHVPLTAKVKLPVDGSTMNELLDELSAEFIETSKYQDFPEGTLGAIQYLSKQHLSKLKASEGRGVLKNELVSMRMAEETIIKGFRVFVADGGVRITLTQEEKINNIDFLIEPISYLITLRNKHNPEELKKLNLLKSKSDTSSHILSLDFKRNSETGIYFIKNIQIREKETF